MAKNTGRGSQCGAIVGPFIQAKERGGSFEESNTQSGQAMTLQEDITEALTTHRREGGIRDTSVHCTCGWSAPILGGGPASRTHQAAILAPIIEAHTREAAADAWDEGMEDGATWQPSTPSGMSNDPPRNPYEMERS